MTFDAERYNVLYYGNNDATPLHVMINKYDDVDDDFDDSCLSPEEDGCMRFKTKIVITSFFHTQAGGGFAGERE